MAKQFRYLFSVAAGLALATSIGCGDNNVACGDDTELRGGVCVAVAQCGPGTMDVDGTCQAVCADGTMFDPSSGSCLPDLTGCAPNMVVVDGVCRDAADVAADIMEPAEPNGFEPGSNAMPIDLPEVGSSLTIGGCSEPQPGADPMGPMQADFDVFVVTAAAPMVLDITVDGYNGMAGGFAVLPLEQALIDNEWGRVAFNLVDDMASREVLLPMAGTYALGITDSRSFMSGPSGDGTTCYLATINAMGLPDPTPIDGLVMGTLDQQVHAYGYDPAADGDLIFSTGSTATAGALIDTVVLIDGMYRQSAPGLDTRAPGEDADTAVADLAADAEVIIYVEAVADFDIALDDYTLDVYSPGPVAMPTDGSTITIDNDANFFRWVYFDATAGDVVHLNFSGTPAAGMRAIVTDSNLLIVSAICGGSCTDYDGFLRFDETGRYYIALFDFDNFNNPDPSSFDFTSSVYNHVPAALATGTPQVGLELDTDGNRFYTLTAADLSWWQYVGETTADFIGELDVSIYPSGAENQRGALGVEIPRATFINGLDLTSDVGGIFDQGMEVLVRANDDGFMMGGTPGTYDLGVVDRAYTDLGTLDPANPYMDTGLMLADGETHRYLMRVPEFSTASIAATGDASTDLAIDVYDAFENADTVDNDFNDGGTETAVEARVFSPLWIAVGVRQWQTGPGGYDINVDLSVPYTITEGALPFTNVCPFPVDGMEAGPGQEVVFDDPDADDGDALDPVSLQFAFELDPNNPAGGEAVTDVWMHTNGFAQFGGPSGVTAFNNASIPNAGAPDFFIAPLWDDYRHVTGCAYSEVDHAVFQWNGVDWDDETTRFEVQLVIRADNSFEIIYGPNHEKTTATATVGFERSDGTEGFQMIFDTESIISAPDKSWTYTP